MQLDLESLSEATSGAIGSLVSTTVLYPLDTCKTKYQAEVQAKQQRRYRNISDVLREAIATRQVLSLYQGLGTKNIQSFISSFLYFYGYSYFRRLYLKKTGKKTIGTKANLLVATAAGVCTIVVTQVVGMDGYARFYVRVSITTLVYKGKKEMGQLPLDTAASRMQTSEFGKSKGFWKTLSEGTWSEAFDGLGISLLLTSNPSIQYTAFDQLKLRLLKGKMNKKIGTKTSPEALSAFSAFMLGAVSKCAATCLTYPAIRCKVMIQSAETDDNRSTEAKRKAQRTISGALYTIWRREGLLGFFNGLQAQILKTVLSAALLLMVKEKITKTSWILMHMIGRYLSAPPKLKEA